MAWNVLKVVCTFNEGLILHCQCQNDINTPVVPVEPVQQMNEIITTKMVFRTYKT